MPRYLVERDFVDGLVIPINAEGASASLDVVRKNAMQDVTWVHSYVSEDKNKSYCIYDGPNPEAIRNSAKKNSLPINKITEVRILDPYFYY